MKYVTHGIMWFCSEHHKTRFIAELKPSLGTSVCYTCKRRIFAEGCSGAYGDVCYLCSKPIYSKAHTRKRRIKFDKGNIRKFDVMLARAIARESGWIELEEITETQ